MSSATRAALLATLALCAGRGFAQAPVASLQDLAGDYEVREEIGGGPSPRRGRIDFRREVRIDVPPRQDEKQRRPTPPGVYRFHDVLELVVDDLVAMVPSPPLAILMRDEASELKMCYLSTLPCDLFEAVDAKRIADGFQSSEMKWLATRFSLHLPASGAVVFEREERSCVFGDRHGCIVHAPFGWKVVDRWTFTRLAPDDPRRSVPPGTPAEPSR